MRDLLFEIAKAAYVAVKSVRRNINVGVIVVVIGIE